VNKVEYPPLDTAEIRNFVGGNERARRSVYERYKRLVAYFIIRSAPNWTTDLQDDAAQEVWLKAFKSAKSLRAESEGELKAWLKSITHSVVNDMARKIARSPKTIDLEAIPDLPDETSDASSKLAARVVFDEFLSGLSETEIIVVNKYFVEEHSYQETAAAAGATKWQVKGIIRNLRKRALAFKKLNNIRSSHAKFIAAMPTEERLLFEGHFVVGKSISAMSRELGFTRKKTRQIANLVAVNISHDSEIKKALGL
jgi:RNA polymerase sigma factor (sigma-70 family)